MKTWGYIYGDESPDIWEHFGIQPNDSDDRIKIKLLSYESADDWMIEKEEE